MSSLPSSSSPLSSIGQPGPGTLNTEPAQPPRIQRVKLQGYQLILCFDQPLDSSAQPNGVDFQIHCDQEEVGIQCAFLSCSSDDQKQLPSRVVLILDRIIECSSALQVRYISGELPISSLNGSPMGDLLRSFAVVNERLSHATHLPTNVAIIGHKPANVLYLIRHYQVQGQRILLELDGELLPGSRPSLNDFKLYIDALAISPAAVSLTFSSAGELSVISLQLASPPPAGAEIWLRYLPLTRSLRSHDDIPLTQFDTVLRVPGERSADTADAGSPNVAVEATEQDAAPKPFAMLYREAAHSANAVERNHNYDHALWKIHWRRRVLAWVAVGLAALVVLGLAFEDFALEVFSL